MTRCKVGASRAATTSLLAAFDPVLYVSALSERGAFAGAATEAEVGLNHPPLKRCRVRRWKVLNGAHQTKAGSAGPAASGRSRKSAGPCTDSAPHAWRRDHSRWSARGPGLSQPAGVVRRRAADGAGGARLAGWPGCRLAHAAPAACWHLAGAGRCGGHVTGEWQA